MAILPSLAIPSTPKFLVKLFHCQPCQLRRSSEIYLPHQTFYPRSTSIKTSTKAAVADHNEPNEVKMQIGIMKEKLREAVPISVQEFPWQKAQNILLDRLLLFVQEALKWSIILYFIFSSLSDVVYTFSVNRELIIPAGLFVGCLMADFLKEISQELFHRSEVYSEFHPVTQFHCLLQSINELVFAVSAYGLLLDRKKDFKWRFLGLCCPFVFVKFMSTWFATQPGVFLLHVANGGLMQVLWYWRNFVEDAKNRQEKYTASSLGA